MFAYVDETGNTGKNIFDPDQPEFFTAALITKTNFDVLHGRTLQSISMRAGVPALHASVVGMGPIESAAGDILSLLKKVDARFFVSRVEKRYLLATKVYDVFFDSGENPAASWSAYNIRPLKMILCFKVATLITEQIARDFWDMLMARNEKTARQKIPGICEALLAQVPTLADARSREVVTETLTWSRDHPEALDIFIAGRQAKNGHMPNMVAFANLLDGLEGFSKRWRRPLKKIVHDRQSQFEGSLAEWHMMFSNASDEPIHRPGETIVFQKVAGSTFEVSASDDSAGIQIADLVLWLFRQHLSGKRLPPASGRLLNYVLKKGYHSDFSFDGVGQQVEEQYRQIMATELTPEMEQVAQKMIADNEQHRRRMVAAYEEDGLMPYQRSPLKLAGEGKD
ncbi:DUF3800 domain-containing protein [Alloyangia pacifica]|uniref:DUF3800 domain-containing protein n=1 Tax=Alloyangia pacifica TaxID=311180 RepID=A0A1I6QKX1_9RHOB|nr:DUF3800 domain-containing protein [Alloyangia pacifica]SDF92147.1 hypothetical protein SAMN04488245_101140 [Alloyangia pacifica]SFS53099.1 hypothetical protein SAMN04488050_102141 [Alloyangia pacifica]